jgi:hypothetical protein
MLPDLQTLLAGYTLYAKQNRFAPDRDESRLAEALGEAGALRAPRTCPAEILAAALTAMLSACPIRDTSRL